MSPMDVEEVDVPAVPLARLVEVLTSERAQRVLEYRERAQHLFEGRTVWNVNATAQGGGVAEMLRQLVGYSRGAAIDTRWLVLAGTPDFYAVTKRLHNRLHGFEGDDGRLDDEALDIYSSTLAGISSSIMRRSRPGDVVLLHDPQTAGLAEPLRSHGLHVVWRCHIGVEATNAWTREAWGFLHGLLDPAEAYVFSRSQYAPAWVPPDRLRVIAPSLDPFSAKNAGMDPEDVAATVSQIASSHGEPALSSDASVILQVSRWDRLKDMAGVLQAFSEHLGQLPDDTHLVLAAPDPAQVDDDPEGASVLAQCHQLRTELPPAARSRVHLWTLPMDDVVANARMVNALQRRATVVVQKSLAEGFGLTVTEPMWKAKPVVASAVGGIQDQIVDGVSGFLLRDPHDHAGFVDLVQALLTDPATRDRVGRAAHERVLQRFLPDRHLIQYVDLFASLLAGERGVFR